MPDFSIERSTVDQYRVQGPHGIWALITIDETHGLLQVASDYGDWSYRWGRLPQGFKRFLCHLAQDYVVDKLTAGARDFDPELTREEIERHVREESIVTPDERDAFLAAFAKESFVSEVELKEKIQSLARDVQDADPDAPDWHEHFYGEYPYGPPTRTVLPRLCCRFYDEVYQAVLVPALQAEIDAEAQQSTPTAAPGAAA